MSEVLKVIKELESFTYFQLSGNLISAMPYIKNYSLRIDCEVPPQKQVWVTALLKVFNYHHFEDFELFKQFFYTKMLNQEKLINMIIDTYE